MACLKPTSHIPWEIGTGKASPGKSCLPFLVAFLLPLSPGVRGQLGEMERAAHRSRVLRERANEQVCALICTSFVCSWGVRNISTGRD